MEYDTLVVNENDQEYLDMLLKMTEDRPEVASTRISSCIVQRNRIVSFGFNQYKSHPFQKRFGDNEHKIYLHAEISAICNALKRKIDLTQCSLYIARIKRPSPNSKVWI